MKLPSGTVIGRIFGSIIFALPLGLSIYLGWKQSVTDEEHRLLTYSADTLIRAEGSSRADRHATDVIAEDHLAPCSPAEFDLMRQIYLESIYLRAVGRNVDDTLACTTLGTPPVPLPRQKSVTEDGFEIRPLASVPLLPSYTPDSQLDLVSTAQAAVVTDHRIVQNQSTQFLDDEVRLYRASTNRPFSSATWDKGLQVDWIHSIPPGSTLTFERDSHIIALARSASYDIGVIAATPIAHARSQVLHFLGILAPIGLLCGGGLAFTIFYFTQKNLSLASILRGAARRREFQVEYQPIVDLQSMRWIGAEALIRWRKDGQNIRPDLFIPTAEESGVIVLITECVAEMVARDLPAFRKLDPDFRIAINLSSLDLKSARTVELIASVLKTSGADARNLEVEATERGFLQGDEVRDVIARIRSLGVRVSIDDFGTGYSSLSRLQELDLDCLKIDKSFVDTIATDGATSQVVLHIIRMATSLKLEMIAEGIEHQSQAEFLRNLGVQMGQGWLFARSMPAAILCEKFAEQMARLEVAR